MLLRACWRFAATARYRKCLFIRSRPRLLCFDSVFKVKFVANKWNMTKNEQQWKMVQKKIHFSNYFTMTLQNNRRKIDSTANVELLLWKIWGNISRQFMSNVVFACHELNKRMGENEEENWRNHFHLEAKRREKYWFIIQNFLVKN